MQKLLLKLSEFTVDKSSEIDLVMQVCLRKISVLNCDASDYEWPAVPEFSFETRKELLITDAETTPKTDRVDSL